MNQLHLFQTVLRMIELEADSPKRAFLKNTERGKTGGN